MVNTFYSTINSYFNIKFIYISSPRRLLQMGVHNAELFNNLGLCCFYAQQYDHTISCFERALNLATDENIADVWYNISHIAIVCIYIHNPLFSNLSYVECVMPIADVGRFNNGRGMFEAGHCER